MDLYDLARRTGYTRRALAEVLGISPVTLDRYLRDNRAPLATERLIEVLAGHMPWTGFEGMAVHRGAIYYRDHPDGLPAKEIPAYQFRLRQLEVVKAELTRYRRAPAQYLLDLTTP